MKIEQRKVARVLFDEYHSESWTISSARAREIHPERPAYSSYEMAANMLAARDFVVLRNTEQPLRKKVLADADTLVLLHPCDRRWERTTSTNSPQLSAEELANVQQFVTDGGGLLVVTEYEHDKYGDNLNDLLAPCGLQIENTTVFDPSAPLHGNPAWFFADTENGDLALLHGVQRACFYQGGSCTASSSARIALSASAQASPPYAGLVGIASHGEGRVAVVTDSLLFGDEHINNYDHRQLWLNLLYWCAAPTFLRTHVETPPSPVSRSASWVELRSAIGELRELQRPDGSIPSELATNAAPLVEKVCNQMRALQGVLPHEGDYLRAVVQDLHTWRERGFAKPDFAASLAAFQPQHHRRDSLETLVLFPMYTPNHSLEVRFEALIMRTLWPDWLAELERTRFRNDKFVPAQLVDYTDGYRSDCAVLFPETVSVHSTPSNQFATIFCNREAARLQRYAQRAAAIARLTLHPQLECLLGAAALIQDTYALWDLVHDRSHSLGELPFDPFMIRRKAPFWAYAIEELRVDLRTFEEANRLAGEGFAFATYVTYTILLDRIFRFPITGTRVRNYDALAGQLLFAYLHNRDILLWQDNRLTVQWDKLAAGIDSLRAELAQLYKRGTDWSQMNFWLAAHDLIAEYVRPNVASQWKRDTRAITDESDPKKWIALVHDDEFPLGNFHLNLARRMAGPA
ncbi:MAG: DUF6421 family protein [Chromatiales bacterium]